MAKPIVISVANQKGGIVKSTTVYNLRAGQATRVNNILLIDIVHQSITLSCQII